MSPRLVKYLYPDQITAFALNRLPALYATNLEGWMQQQQSAQEELAHQMAIAVRQPLWHFSIGCGTSLGRKALRPYDPVHHKQLRTAIAAVQRDSLKAGTLLPCSVSSQSFPITALLA